MDNDVERVRKNAINVENQLKEIRKSLHQRYQNGQRKPNNQNQLECKVENNSRWRKNTASGRLDDLWNRPTTSIN